MRWLRREERTLREEREIVIKAMVFFAKETGKPGCEVCFRGAREGPAYHYPNSHDPVRRLSVDFDLRLPSIGP